MNLDQEGIRYIHRYYEQAKNRENGLPEIS